MTIRFEWDHVKRRRNLRKHGIDFADCEALFKGPTLTVEHVRFGYGERRFFILGLLDDRV